MKLPGRDVTATPRPTRGQRHQPLQRRRPLRRNPPPREPAPGPDIGAMKTPLPPVRSGIRLPDSPPPRTRKTAAVVFVPAEPHRGPADFAGRWRPTPLPPVRSGIRLPDSPPPRTRKTAAVVFVPAEPSPVSGDCSKENYRAQPQSAARGSISPTPQYYAERLPGCRIRPELPVSPVSGDCSKENYRAQPQSAARGSISPTPQYYAERGGAGANRGLATISSGGAAAA